MPKRKKLLWRLYPTYLVIILLSLIAVAWHASAALRHFFYSQTAADLKIRAFLTRRLIADKLSPADQDEVDRLCVEINSAIATRITIILPNGIVIGDSESDPDQMDNHGDRPEIRDALSGMIGTSIRSSPTLQQEMMYVAVPVEREGLITGVVRVSMPVTTLRQTLSTIHLRMALGGMAVALLAAVLSLFIARHINKPIEEIRRGADRFASGDLEHRLLLPDDEELGSLAMTLNQMAAQLHERIRTVTAQRNELEAVLSSMVEAVLVIDTEERIVQLNQAAMRLFGLKGQGAAGRNIREVIRNTDLLLFLNKTFSTPEPVEDDIAFHSGSERFLQAHGTILRDAGGKTTGALIVLDDVTRLKNLENIRRDFVANVSHELKTPITSITGFVETLRDGAIEDKENAGRFLEIIARQADRLNAIIDDLLSLSRIEQEGGTEQITFEVGCIRQVVESAILVCSDKAQARRVKIDLSCDDGLSVSMNPALLEQAVINLIDNAIKYSDAESTVRVEAVRAGRDAVITIRDQGCGIPKEHLSRIFERFYRVDKARSRKLGGTGLGLAIVKHIVQTHGGRISVESAPRQGSAFSMYLPGVRS
ncbi:MAG: two-component system histidine kinase PnpS [bacterium]